MVRGAWKRLRGWGKGAWNSLLGWVGGPDPEDDSAVPDAIVDRIPDFETERADVMKSWKEVFASAKTVMNYSGASLIALLVFAVTSNLTHQTHSASADYYVNTAGTTTAAMSMTVLSAALLLLYLNRDAVQRARHSTVKYTKKLHKDLLKPLTDENLTTQFYLRLPFYAARPRFYYLGCLTILLLSFTCAVVQVWLLTNTAYSHNLIVTKTSPPCPSLLVPPPPHHTVDLPIPPPTPFSPPPFRSLSRLEATFSPPPFPSLQPTQVHVHCPSP